MVPGDLLVSGPVPDVDYLVGKNAAVPFVFDVGAGFAEHVEVFQWYGQIAIRERWVEQ